MFFSSPVNECQGTSTPGPWWSMAWSRHSDLSASESGTMRRALRAVAVTVTVSTVSCLYGAVCIVWGRYIGMWQQPQAWPKLCLLLCVPCFADYPGPLQLNECRVHSTHDSTQCCSCYKVVSSNSSASTVLLPLLLLLLLLLIAILYIYYIILYCLYYY